LLNFKLILKLANAFGVIAQISKLMHHRAFLIALRGARRPGAALQRGALLTGS
jgi:hypothetical protein